MFIWLGVGVFPCPPPKVQQWNHVPERQAVHKYAAMRGKDLQQTLAFHQNADYWQWPLDSALDVKTIDDILEGVADYQ